MPFPSSAPAGQSNCYADLRAADIYMIAAGDGQIVQCCEELAAAGKLSAHTLVFHCSGALPSSILQAAARNGAAIASVHPIRSFADPEQAANEFAGTYCGVEGDAQALAILNEAFALIGARLERGIWKSLRAIHEADRGYCSAPQRFRSG